MNVCRISKGFLPRQDGWSAHAFFLSQQQAALGHSVVVLQPSWPSEKDGRLTIRRLPLGPLTSRLEWKLTTGLFCAQAAAAIAHLLRREKIDVLHVHGDVIEVLSLASWARFWRVPVVLTLHSGLNRRWLYRGIATRLFRLVDGFICVSPPIREDVLSLGLPEDRTTVIPSGLDIRQYRPPTHEERVAARANLALQDDEAMILSVGRLHPVKAYADLVRTAAGTPIAPKVRFIIAGEGPERERLRRSAQGLPNVQFVGGVDRQQVINYLHAADLFVMPSVDLPGVREGTPTAMLEAMACGLPIVCTDSGGLGHLVRDGENGLVCSQRDVRGLRAALQMLVLSPELRRQFGERNATQVQDRDWRRTADRVTAFYQHILRMRTTGQRTNVWQS